MTSTRSSFVLLVILVAQALTFSQVHAQAQDESGGDALLRQRAEDLAKAASERFSEILSGETGDEVAQGPARETEPLDPVWDWLGQASRAYRGVIITKLKSPSGEVAVLVPPGRAAPKLPTAPAASEVAREPELRLGWTYLVESVREWLADANRSYRTEVVKKLVQPVPSVPSRTAEAVPEPASALPEPAPQQMAAAPKVDGVGDEAKAVQPKVESKAESKAEAKRKAAAEAEAEAKRKAVSEAKQKAEAAAKRKAEAEDNRKSEAEAAAKRKAEAGANRKVEAEAAAKRKAEAEAKRKAEAEAAAKRKAEA
ncbi:MAG TPA: hypothetical protein VGA65_02710, partial [Hyphomicrobium sp.]